MSPARRFAGFCIAGFVGLLVDLGVLYVAAPLLGWYVGRLVSFAAAVTATWQINRRLAFADSLQVAGAQVWVQYARYVTSMLAGATINYLVYALTLEMLPSTHAPAWGVAFGSIAGLSFNFASARYLVFRRAGTGR